MLIFVKTKCDYPFPVIVAYLFFFVNDNSLKFYTGNVEPLSDEVPEEGLNFKAMRVVCMNVQDSGIVDVDFIEAAWDRIDFNFLAPCCIEAFLKNEGP